MKRERLKKWPKRIPTWRQIWERATRGMPEWKLKYGGRPKPRYYVAQGGPYSGKILTLVDGDTAPIRVGSERGRYFCGEVASRWCRPYRGGGTGTTKWIPTGDV